MVNHRRLGTTEHIWYRLGQIDSNNFVMAAQVDGEVDERKVKTAVNSLVESQLWLRSSVEFKNNKPHLSVRDTAPVEIRVLNRSSSDCWQAIVEEELNSQLKVDEFPLWRFTWIKGEKEHEFLLTLNHMIFDGKSGLNFFDFFFKKLEDPQYELLQSPLIPPYEKTLLKTDNIISSTLKTFRSLWEYFFTKKRAWSKIPAVDNGLSRSALISRTLSAESTSRLVEKCRSESVSVSSYLSAVMTGILGNQKDHAVSMSLAVDMRPFLRNYPEYELGYFVTSIDLVKDINAEEDTWGLARHFKSRIKRQLNKSQFKFDQFIRFLALKSAKSNEQLSKLIKESLNNSLLLTNLGQAKVKAEYKCFTLKHCFHVPSVHLMKLPFLCLATCTVNGVMVLNFTYNAGCMDRAEVEGFVEEIMAGLVFS